MDLDERRRRAAYHESGHALAAVKRGGYVKYIDLSRVEEEEQETQTALQAADVAFMVWAGLWAQAQWEGNATYERIVAIFQTQSFWDWPIYEKRFGRDVQAWANAANAAVQLDRPFPKDPPPVSAPPTTWDLELHAAWPEIQELAEKLLLGESSIALPNAQTLLRDGFRDYWSDCDVPTVVDDLTLPAVR